MVRSARGGADQFAVQEGARPSPGALDGGFAHAERLRRLLDGEPAEEAQLDDAAEVGIEGRRAG